MTRIALTLHFLSLVLVIFNCCENQPEVEKFGGQLCPGESQGLLELVHHHLGGAAGVVLVLGYLHKAVEEAEDLPLIEEEGDEDGVGAVLDGDLV